MPIGGALRVKALQPARRRAGFAFTSIPRELAFEELGEGLAGFIRLVMICEDPYLKVTLVNGDDELPVDSDVLAAMQSVLEAEKLRVDPANPPAPISGLMGERDAAAPASAGEGDQQPSDPALDQPMTMHGDGPTQAGDADVAGPVAGEASPPLVPAGGPESGAVGNNTPSDAHASDAGPTIADTTASESQPAGEQTGSPAADAKQRPNTRREKAKA